MTSHKPPRDLSSEPPVAGANKENDYTQAQNSRILRFGEERKEGRPISPYQKDNARSRSLAAVG